MAERRSDKTTGWLPDGRALYVGVPPGSLLQHWRKTTNEVTGWRPK